MGENPETKITRRVRRAIEGAGGEFVKLSDSFTRGVPDSYVVGNLLVMIEFKVDRSKGTKDVRTYKSLGLSGAQDHRIRQICHRAVRCAMVVTDLEDGGRLRVWQPHRSHLEGPGNDEYFLLCEGIDDFLAVLGLR